MRFFRFFTNVKLDEVNKNLILNDQGIIHKIKNVLRLKTGSRITLFNDDGFDYECEIKSLNAGELFLEMIRRSGGLVDKAKPKVNLFISLVKKDKLEWILEKGTEIGVSEFHLIISERSEKKDFSFERGERKIIEALEQSGRNKKPKLFKIEKLNDCLKKDFIGEKVFLSLNVTNNSDEILTNKNIQEVNIFVGPEGGWSEKEEKLFEKASFKGINLNTAVLKTETACLTIVSKILI